MSQTPKSPSAPKRSTYNPEVADAIVARIADGESLRGACRELGANPARFFEWLNESADLAERYARARDLRGELLADEIVDAARDATAENANAVRVLVDALKWSASKLAPRRYGDRLELAGSKDAPLKVEVEVIGGSE